jgi:hypothetical protein
LEVSNVRVPPDDPVDAVDQRSKVFLGLAQGFFGLHPLGIVAHQLAESHQPPFAPDGGHHPGGVESAAVLAHMPSLVLRAAFPDGLFHLHLDDAGFPVLWREEYASGPTQDFSLGIFEQFFRAGAPGVDCAVRIEQDDGVVRCRIQDELELFLAAP